MYVKRLLGVLLLTYRVILGTVQLTNSKSQHKVDAKYATGICLEPPTFEDPQQDQETIFKIHLMIELPKKIKRYRQNCHKTITLPDQLLVMLSGNRSSPDPKTGEKRSGTLYIYFRMTALTYMIVKFIICPFGTLLVLF